jgi:hypothetical protein
MSETWYKQVRTNSKSRSIRAEKRGSEVTVRIDPEVYAQARLRKAVANAMAKGYTLTEEAQAQMLEHYKFEAITKKVKS